MGSDPLRILLLFNWVGSKPVKGAGAKASALSQSSSTDTSFTNLKLLKMGMCTLSHLSARSMFLSPLAPSGWRAKNKIQRSSMATLWIKTPICTWNQKKDESIRIQWGGNGEEKDVTVIYAEPKFRMAHCCKKLGVSSFYGIGWPKSKRHIWGPEHVGKS